MRLLTLLIATAAWGQCDAAPINCQQVKACFPSTTTTTPTTTIPPTIPSVAGGIVILPQLQVGSMTAVPADMSKALHSVKPGDNLPYGMVVDRPYTAPDDQYAGFGFYGTGERPTNVFRGFNPLQAIVSMRGSPNLGISQAGTPTIAAIAGTVPTTKWGCLGVAFGHSLINGETLPGPFACAQFLQGGLHVTYNGFWPTPIKGKAVALIYYGEFPSKPNIVSKAPFVVLLDLLQSQSDYIDITLDGMIEMPVPTNVNLTGWDYLSVHDADFGYPTWRSGDVTHVTYPIDGGNGWLYGVWGFSCDSDCKHCRRDRGVPIVLGPQAPSWRTNTIPFCDAQHVAYRRQDVIGASVVVTHIAGKATEVQLDVGADGDSVVQKVLH